MDQSPLVSVVIPTYNRAHLITAAVESLLAQTYRKLEIIVVDDGSVDTTADVVQKLIERVSCAGGKPGEKPEIRYIYQANMGQSGARNTGIDAAHGDWIGFLDSDDHWLPEKIEWQLRAIEQFKDKCGVCVSDARLINASDNLDTTAFRLVGRDFKEVTGVFPDIMRDLARGVDGCWIPATLVRRDLLRNACGFDRHLHFMEDHDLLFRLSLATPFCYVNLPLAVFDRASTATDPEARVRTWDSAEFRLAAQQHIYEKWLTLNGPVPPDVRKTIIGNLRAVHSARANLFLKREQFDLARDAVSAAIKCEFTSKLALKWLLARFAPHIAKSMVPSHDHRS